MRKRRAQHDGSQRFFINISFVFFVQTLVVFVLWLFCLDERLQVFKLIL